MTTYWYTQGHETYEVNERGEVSRPAIGMKASGQWRITGAVRFNNFGQIAERIPFPACFMSSPRWLHKNGKGRVFLCDIDHGTKRVQMNAVLRAGYSG